LLLLLWPLAARSLKRLLLLPPLLLRLLLRSLMPLLLPLQMLPLPQWLPLRALLMPLRLQRLLLRLPASNRSFADSEKPPVGGFFFGCSF
jgi:hypothetical protein